MVIALCAALGWAGGSVLGASLYAHGEPVNWRVFAGPWVYLRWLDRRKAVQ
jgi:hypothetical protein